MQLKKYDNVWYLILSVCRNRCIISWKSSLIVRLRKFVLMRLKIEDLWVVALPSVAFDVRCLVCTEWLLCEYLWLEFIGNCYRLVYLILILRIPTMDLMSLGTAFQFKDIHIFAEPKWLDFRILGYYWELWESLT